MDGHFPANGFVHTPAPDGPLDPNNAWDAYERVQQALDILQPLTKAELTVRAMVRPVLPFLHTMLDELDALCVVEAEVYEEPLTAHG